MTKTALRGSSATTPSSTTGRRCRTRFWLVGRADVRAVSRLEADGGVAAAEAAVDAAELAAAHARYAAERDAAVQRRSASGPVPTGGVGGTRRGVKCLHAHYAWHLAGGDDPVGRWVAERLAAAEKAAAEEDAAEEPPGLDIAVDAVTTTFRHGGATMTVPIGPESLLAGELRDPDPPDAAQLTNALGLVADHLDDLVREQPTVVASRHVHVAGAEPWHLVVVERGGPVAEPSAVLERVAAEDVFRLLATATRAERLHNPGLDPERVDTVLGTCCLLLAVMRRLHLDEIAVSPAAAA